MSQVVRIHPGNPLTRWMRSLSSRRQSGFRRVPEMFALLKEFSRRPCVCENKGACTTCRSRELVERIEAGVR
jgi:hypothetical protein